MDNKPKSPGQLAYEPASYLSLWIDISRISGMGLSRMYRHIKALKADAQAVTRATRQREDGKTE